MRPIITIHNFFFFAALPTLSLNEGPGSFQYRLGPVCEGDALAWRSALEGLAFWMRKMAFGAVQEQRRHAMVFASISVKVENVALINQVWLADVDFE
jgi:hypothetical protein